MNYYNKYLKYKSKYLKLKGGNDLNKLSSDVNYNIISFLDFVSLGNFLNTNKEYNNLRYNNLVKFQFETYFF